VVDLEARYAVTSKLNLALGADNRFVTYPETLPAFLNTTTNTPLSTFTPFGFSGRFIYARANYSF
jgi:iron complex outermembrane receptor protein